jgi:hypothetical protein
MITLRGEPFLLGRKEIQTLARYLISAGREDLAEAFFKLHRRGMPLSEILRTLLIAHRHESSLKAMAEAYITSPIPETFEEFVRRLENEYRGIKEGGSKTPCSSSGTGCNRLIQFL